MAWLSKSTGVRSCMMLLTAVSLALSFSIHSPVTSAAAMLTVTTTTDTDAVDGACSLREAIEAVNDNASYKECVHDGTTGTVTIAFSIGASGKQTIVVASALPIITRPVIINGTSQPGFQNAPLIELNGAGYSGLTIAGGGSTIRGLVINRFSGAGVALKSANNVVAGNYIGTDSNGTARRANGSHGVLIEGADNIVGGTAAGDRNIISANGGRGIYINGLNADRNIVHGNYIGLTADGTTGLGNDFAGIRIDNGSNNRIGGTTAAERNVISKNGFWGVRISGASANGNKVQGNYIGTAADGTSALGNAPGGVLVEADAKNNVVGGTTAGEANLIAHNGGAGVSIGTGGGAVIGNAVRGNSIHSNSGFGIDISNNGITPNDAGDPDLGPNKRQNFPSITSAVIDGDNLLVTSSIDSTPANSTYPVTIEVFQADSISSGEGKKRLGAGTISGPGSATVNLGSAATLAIAANDPIVATATDANGNTSEFSPVRFVDHNDSRETADPVDPGTSTTDTALTPADVRWFQIPNVPSGATINVDLSSTADYDMYLLAPAINEENGQLRDQGSVVTNQQLEGITQIKGIPQLDGITQIKGIPQLDGITQIKGIPQLDGITQIKGIPQLDDTGETVTASEIGNVVAFSANAGSGIETVAHDVNELGGPYYVVVVPHDASVVNTAFTLTPIVTPGEQPPAITKSIAQFPIPATNTGIQTLILTNQARLSRFYGSTSASPDSKLTEVPVQLDALAADPNVHGRVVNLDTVQGTSGTFAVRDAYLCFDGNLPTTDPDASACQPSNPQAANYVARTIKSLIYSQAQAYPNLKYIVIVGNDNIIPARRIVDEALLFNERMYGTSSASDSHNGVPVNTPIGDALLHRYFLSDDYYAGLLPIPFKGRELYIPQFGLGRLVETPTEILAPINAFLNGGQTITPSSALTTGYDFLTQQANNINTKLGEYGVAGRDVLINDSWTADDFRLNFFGPQTAPRPLARGLNSLNSHYDHDNFYPNDNNTVTATEVKNSLTTFTNSLLFSVGCHSGLVVPDNYSYSAPRSATDWPQVYNGRGASWMGNYGFGYADRDLVLYSSRLMEYFVERLGLTDGGSIPSSGRALMLAKQDYLNGIVDGTFSNYDEKVLEQMTLFGLPMQKVRLPNQVAPPQAQNQTSYNLSFNYSANSLSGRGTFYTINGSDEFSASAGAPVQPQQTLRINVPDQIARGTLMLGGSFHDTANFDPVITNLTNDQELVPRNDPPFTLGQWFPSHVVSVNRVLTLNEVRQQVVVVPGQFQPDASGNTEIERLYDNLQLQVLTAPYSNPDWSPPQITDIATTGTPTSLQFRAHVDDESGMIQRVIALYLKRGTTTWARAELTYDSTTGNYSATVPPVGGTVDYFIQAADGAGNVTVGLNHGNYYSVATPTPAVPTFSAPLLVNEGANIPLVVTSPSTGSTYAFDCGTGYGSFGTANTTTCTTTANGTRTVGAQVKDANGIVTSFTTNITILNQAPIVSAAGDSSAPKVVSKAFNLGSFSDVAGDRPWTVEVNWGDGSSPTTFNTSSVGVLDAQTHTYATFGQYKVTVKVTDKDGETGFEAFQVRVAYEFSGFFQPVDNPPVVNVANAGSSIPVKFSLNGYQGLDIFVAGYPKVVSVPCPNALVDTIEETTATATSGLNYDSVTAQYIYTWKTSSTWDGTCRQLFVRLNDGTDHIANFQFAK